MIPTIRLIQLPIKTIGTWIGLGTKLRNGREIDTSRQIGNIL